MSAKEIVYTDVARNLILSGVNALANAVKVKGSYGYNAATGEYGDLLEQGVIDPVKVVRTALQNAASVAGLMLTTEALVAERPKAKGAAPASHADHGDY